MLLHRTEQLLFICLFLLVKNTFLHLCYGIVTMHNSVDAIVWYERAITKFSFLPSYPDPDPLGYLVQEVLKC